MAVAQLPKWQYKFTPWVQPTLRVWGCCAARISTVGLDATRQTYSNARGLQRICGTPTPRPKPTQCGASCEQDELLCWYPGRAPGWHWHRFPKWHCGSASRMLAGSKQMPYLFWRRPRQIATAGFEQIAGGACSSTTTHFVHSMHVLPTHLPSWIDLPQHRT